MAARKSKQHTTRKQISPSLDDPDWVLLILAHRIRSEQLTGVRHSHEATLDLTEGLKSGKLRCMRRSLTDSSERERLPASFWQGLRIDVEADSIRFLPGLPIRRFLDFQAINAWTYYVWRPDIGTLWPAERPDQQEATKMSPSGKLPGPKPRGDWQLHVARELYARAKAGEKDPPLQK